MKLNKLSIFALMTLGGLMAFGPIAGAQAQTNSTTPPPAGPPGGRPNMKKIIEQLKLTDDQTEKVKPILKDQAEKMKALREDTSLTPQDRRPKMKEIRDDTNAKLKPILTDEQFAEWQKLTQRGGHGKKQDATPPADLPTTK
jgi:periplasmic protein CpxP/Spy